jgi:hypothetical protein
MKARRREAQKHPEEADSHSEGALVRGPAELQQKGTENTENRENVRFGNGYKFELIK